MPSVIFPEYRNSLKSVKYPFTDTATLESTDGSLTLPKEVFCDANLYIPGAVAPLYIQKINITNALKTITVSDYSKKYTATGEIKPLSDSVELFDNRNRSVGILVASSDLTYFTSVPTGEYEFTYKSTPFVPRCITSLVDTGITSIGTETEALTGDIWWVGKQGIILRYVDDAIRVDIVGEPLFKYEDPNFTPPTFVQTINGVEADKYGDFKITVLDPKDILRVENSANGITIYAAGV